MASSHFVNASALLGSASLGKPCTRFFMALASTYSLYLIADSNLQKIS